MKKLIGFILVIAIAVGGYFAYTTYFSPEATAERNLMGEWVGSYEIGSIVFEEEGVIKLKVGNISTDGSYTADYETGKISFTYSILGFSYEKEYDFEVTETSLTLTDNKLDITLNYTKVVEE